MQIYGSTLVHGPQAMNSPHRVPGTQAADRVSSLSEGDHLDISAAGQLASRSLEGSSRSDRVAEIRAAIQAGTYDTEEKLSAALDRLLDQIG
jgi:anti-sigma28 factor (negative regulator of flagellin synthesis)